MLQNIPLAVHDAMKWPNTGQNVNERQQRTMDNANVFIYGANDEWNENNDSLNCIVPASTGRLSLSLIGALTDCA